MALNGLISGQTASARSPSLVLLLLLEVMAVPITLPRSPPQTPRLALLLPLPTPPTAHTLLLRLLQPLPPRRHQLLPRAAQAHKRLQRANAAIARRGGSSSMPREARSATTNSLPRSSLILDSLRCELISRSSCWSLARFPLIYSAVNMPM